MDPSTDYIRAHAHCIRHYRELLASQLCGCFGCLAIFPPFEIDRWLSDGPTDAEQTAWCPYCGVDTVIGSASGYPITAEFLMRMKQHWCSGDESEDDSLSSS
jgi:hypothetical protein